MNVARAPVAHYYDSGVGTGTGATEGSMESTRSIYAGGVAARLSPRQVRLLVRDGRMVTGRVYVAEAHSLLQYLTTRKTYANLVQVRYAKGDEAPLDHLALRVDSIVWASSADGDIPLVNHTAAAAPRPVLLHLPGGDVIQGELVLAPRQRLSDYVDTIGPFLPVHNAVMERTGQSLGDVAIHQTTVLGVRERAT